jgi:hypothetical protein
MIIVKEQNRHSLHHQALFQRAVIISNGMEWNLAHIMMRLQPGEYTIRATGCVPTASGIQSLMSVYLLVLWVLTYFGKPFE